MDYEIKYKQSVFSDLKNLDKEVARRILNTIEKKLSSDPLRSEPLTGQFKGMEKLRVGNYRAILKVVGDQIIILRIRPRKNVYKKSIDQ